jgi:hypothetical protein
VVSLTPLRAAKWGHRVVPLLVGLPLQRLATIGAWMVGPPATTAHHGRR